MLDFRMAAVGAGKGFQNGCHGVVLPT
jgi:hypothetical protein